MKPRNKQMTTQPDAISQEEWEALGNQEQCRRIAQALVDAEDSQLLCVVTTEVPAYTPLVPILKQLARTYLDTIRKGKDGKAR